MRGQGSGPTASRRLVVLSSAKRAGGERRVSEARVIIASGSGRNRFERGSIEPPIQENPRKGILCLCYKFSICMYKKTEPKVRRQVHQKGVGREVRKEKLEARFA